MGRGLRCRWIEPSASEMPDGWEGPPLVGRLLAQRESKIKRPQSISQGSPNRGARPRVVAQHHGSGQAILAELDNTKGTLWIHGDYDADGITGSTILARMLGQLRPGSLGRDPRS